MKELDRRGITLEFDIVGEGPLLEECRALESELKTVRARVLDQVPYGPTFFKLIRAYHAIVVPSLSDEQPRIVFDANSQALPDIASDTDGLRPYVHADATGWLLPRRDASRLADLLQQLSSEPRVLQNFGMCALAEAEKMTHRAMHERHWRVLLKHFGSV
jgi:glycosyltransferase involved in cell wall biosynthesis